MKPRSKYSVVLVLIWVGWSVGIFLLLGWQGTSATPKEIPFGWGPFHYLTKQHRTHFTPHMGSSSLPFGSDAGRITDLWDYQFHLPGLLLVFVISALGTLGALVATRNVRGWVPEAERSTAPLVLCLAFAALACAVTAITVIGAQTTVSFQPVGCHPGCFPGWVVYPPAKE